MDTFALSAANILAGNEAGAAALEWSLGGGAIRFDADCTFALAGATADATLEGAPVPPLTTLAASAGDTLAVGGFASGRFLYLAISGGIGVDPSWEVARLTCPRISEGSTED